MKTEIKNYECRTCTKTGSFNTPKLKKYARCQNCGSHLIIEVGSDVIRLLKLLNPEDLCINFEDKK